MRTVLYVNVHRQGASAQHPWRSTRAIAEAGASEATSGTVGTAAVASTGGGGGGANQATSVTGGAGGSGLVVILVPKS